MQLSGAVLFLLCTISAAKHDSSAGHANIQQLGHLRQSLVPQEHNVAAFGHPSEHFKDAGSLLELPKAKQDPGDGSVTTTEYKNWFERMGGALVSFCLSFAVFGLSVALLWVNERRAARMDALLGYGERECISVEEASEDDRGELVHVSGGSAMAKAPIECKLVQGIVLKACLRFMTTVEVYQWVEHKDSSEKKDMVGGGKTTTTTYRYEQRWDSTKHNSSQFQNKNKQNRFPVKPQINTVSSSKVEYKSGTSSSGADWILPTDLVNQLTDFEDASRIVGATQVTMSEGGVSLRKEGKEDEFYYSANSARPKIGDVRVKFSYIADNKEVTVVALQAQARKASLTETFIPYRPISRGLCGVNDKARKDALTEEGKKSQAGLVEADRCDMGCFNIFCCVFCFCNILQWVSVLGPPSIFNLFPGCLTKGECFNRLRNESATWKWIFRLGGWLLMIISVMMFFEPVFMVLNIVPFVEYLHITDALSFVVFILATLVTAAVATLIVGAAYMAYRPMSAMALFTLAAAIAAIPIAMNMGHVHS